jgi:hypothetical protein
LGDDADTVGAIYGNLAGAFYGEIPAKFSEKIFFKELFINFGEILHEISVNKVEKIPEEKKLWKIYATLEEYWRKNIVFKRIPGPKMYRKLEDLESDSILFREWAQEISENCTKEQKIALVKFMVDFEKMTKRAPAFLQRGPKLLIPKKQ